MRANTTATFWSRVEKSGETDCWLWQGTVDSTGYGSIWIGGKKLSAHRLSWQLHFGSPKNQINHTCHVKRCVNPGHLYDGTQRDNVQDEIERGTFVRGSRVGTAKLTEFQVQEMRERYAAGERAATLARAFDISQTTASRILSPHSAIRCWDHVCA